MNLLHPTFDLVDARQQICWGLGPQRVLELATQVGNARRSDVQTAALESMGSAPEDLLVSVTSQRVDTVLGRGEIAFEQVIQERCVIAVDELTKLIEGGGIEDGQLAGV